MRSSLTRQLPLLALLLLGSLPAHAKDELPILEFEKLRLDNGLEVILHHDSRLPLVALSVWYHVGAAEEKAGHTGFAHLFEHMMFEGSADVGMNKHFEYLTQAGGTQANGTTEFDRTNYFETLPRNELELGLWLESDRMGYLLSTLTQARLDNQREVVKNERRQSFENAPYGLMSEMITQTLYPVGHPYHGNIIGSMEDLSRASLDDVREFFNTYYTPANATLAIAGDYDPTTIKALVGKYFGPLKGRPKPPPVKLAVPSIAKEQLIRFDEPVATLSKLSMVWMGPPVFEPDTAELELLTHVISGTKSSRLDKKVAYEDLIAQSVTAGLGEFAAGSQFHIELVVRENRTLEEAHQAVDAVLDDFRKNPPTEAELRRALNAQETHLIAGLELLGGFGGRAERLQTYNHHLGDPGKLAWDVGRYRKVTVADLKRVFDRVLTDKRLVVYATPIKKKAAPGGAQ